MEIELGRPTVGSELEMCHRKRGRAGKRGCLDHRARRAYDDFWALSGGVSLAVKREALAKAVGNVRNNGPELLEAAR
jgi:hypothetical protein